MFNSFNEEELPSPDQLPGEHTGDMDSFMGIFVSGHQPGETFSAFTLSHIPFHNSNQIEV